MKAPILIIGMGSIGKRHRYNAIELGCKVHDWDISPRDDFLKFLDMSRGLTNHVVICSPPECHKQQVLDCLDRGYNVLCEKPLALYLEDVEEILHHPNSNRCFVGYQMRFLRSLRRMKVELGVQRLRSLHVMSHSVFGHDVNDWKRYDNTPYPSRIGILLEASHELDYLLWSFDYDFDYRKDLDIRGVCMLNQLRNLDGGPHRYLTNETACACIIKLQNVLHTVQLDYETAKYTREWTLRSDRCSFWKYNALEGYGAYKDELSAFLGYTNRGHDLCTVRQAYVLHTLMHDIKLFNLKVTTDECNSAFEREDLIHGTTHS